MILIAVEIFLTATNLGFFSSGKIAFTILHIPVFIAVILIGLPQGVLLAAVFGVSSLITAYLHPTGALDLLFQNPLISVLPRILVPFAVWAIYKIICRLVDDHTLSAELICTGFSSLSGVIINAVFVMTALVALHPEAIGVRDNFSASTVVITNIVAVNMAYEILIAVAVTCLTALILRKRSSGSEDTAFSENDTSQENSRNVPKEHGRPIQITFQKWLFLFMVLIFLGMLVFMYQLFSERDLRNSEAHILSEANWIAEEIRAGRTTFTKDALALGTEGSILLTEDGTVFLSAREDLMTRSLSDICPGYEKIQTDTITILTIDGIQSMGLIEKTDDYLVVLFIPESEIYAGRNHSLANLLLGLLVLFLMLFVIISVLLKRNVVQRIHTVNISLGQIRAGNLDEKVRVTGNIEFEELSLGINTTVDALKETMLEIEKKNQQEMEFAREVQHSALPSGSLSCQGLSVLGSMQAAREVGGDFYDYFLIGDDKLGIVIADVSGKGVPAALFMMTVKTLIKNLVLSGKSPAEALQSANIQLCENNEKGMFVTVWLGILNLKTHRLEFANAGHNAPLLRKTGEAFRYMDYKKYRRGFVLGGISETRYHNNEIDFEQGALLFLYTDGVTEAANPGLELYGEERLQKCMETCRDLEPEALLRAVRQDIDAFAAGAEQYDDITMVVLKS